MYAEFNTSKRPAKTRCEDKRDEEEITRDNLHDVFLYGGIGYGKICVPNMLTDLIIIIVFPPLYVYFHQRDRNFNNITQIIISFILTSCMYFPGLIHAFLVKLNREQCGSLFRKRDVSDQEGGRDLKISGSDVKNLK